MAVSLSPIELHREAATEPAVCPRCGQVSRTAAELLAADEALRGHTAWRSHRTSQHCVDMRSRS